MNNNPQFEKNFRRLFNQYADSQGIIEERLSNGSVRYRQTAPNATGVWVSKSNLYSQLIGKENLQNCVVRQAAISIGTCTSLSDCVKPDYLSARMW
jgi:hypothetical protein